MLVKHAQTAHSMGIPAENTVIINNGDIVGLSANSIDVVGQVSSGIELVDQSGIVHEQVMKERQQLAEEGVVTVAAAVNWEGQLIAQPEIHLRGVVTAVERSLLQRLIIRTIEKTLSDRWSEFTQASNGYQIEVDWAGLRKEIESNLQRLARREFQSRPLVVFLLQTPEQPPAKSFRRRSTASVTR